MIDNVLIVLQATSILLAIFFAISYWKSRKALERELSSYRGKPEEKPPDAAGPEIVVPQQIPAIDIEQEKRQVEWIIEEYKQIKLELTLRELKEMRQHEMELWRLQVAALEAKIATSEEIHQQELLNQKQEIEKYKSILLQMRSSQTAATEALRREALQKNEYNLQLDDTDRLEIADLQTIATRYPRIRPVLLKAIYEIYYAPGIKQLLSRVVGDGKVSGIYRITSKLDGRIYIGKSVDIRTRWINHFKRAAGVETETNNLLYPAMRKQGLENFSFEVIERVEEEKLSEREKYWQEFYDAKTHGFSVR
jgi:hypothetical protein